ncbi:MAG: tetratricopeptide repeat protein, partial [Isosphaeraceae bacterium]
RIDPRDAIVFIKRGYVQYARKEYVKALADYNEAIHLNPKSANAFGVQAWIWATCPDETVRNGKKAVESATRACELNEWNVANDFDTLAAAYAEIGDFDKAVEWQEKAIANSAKNNGNPKGMERLELYKNKTPYREESKD